MAVPAQLGVDFAQAEQSLTDFEPKRASRFPFAAKCEVTEMDSARLVTAFTSNLSLFGCYVLTGKPFPEGTKVSVRIVRGSTSFAASGNVMYSRPNYGMGNAFTEIEPFSQSTLEKWLESMQSKSAEWFSRKTEEGPPSWDREAPPPQVRWVVMGSSILVPSPRLSGSAWG